MDKVNITSSYTYVYEAIQVKIILPCLVRGLWYLSSPLDFTALHVTPVILHFIKFLSCNGASISVLVFWCNNPTYYPSYVTLYGNNVAETVVASPSWHAYTQTWHLLKNIEHKLLKGKSPVLGDSTDDF